MHILFVEAGKFQAGRILSETDHSAQVELGTGKRVKVRAAHQLLRFEQPGPAELLSQAQTKADAVDLNLAWECAPEEEFGFGDLASDYFGDSPSTVQQAAALLALHGAPHYFRRAGRGGRFRKAPADIVQQALAAIERREQIEAQISAWADELAAGQCPQPIRDEMFRILFRPDKNAPEYKAVVEAARRSQLAPLALLTRAGAIGSAYQFHWQRFLFEQFPQGTEFPEIEVPSLGEDLPLAAVQAWSIDDADTTEIDDALSLQGLDTGTVTLGIHIAAPGLLIQPGDALDDLGRRRLSTVYMPGHKITMLPAAVVDAVTLMAGRAAPAISLYITLDEATLQMQGSETRLEQIQVAGNLRHDQLEPLITTDWLEDGDDTDAPMPRAQLAFLHRLALHLKGQRELVRGKPENFTRPDYSFQLLGMSGDEPTGEERVRISVRQRGAPLDLIVSELMVLANSTWGEWLKSLGVPGIYRSQASLAPGVKVRMGTRALPHAGIGVPSYCWSTSPLRRYADLVNQWQIIAAARHGTAAALAAPFKPKDTDLLAIISAFDAAYSAYNSHQASMERFWTLRYLEQEGITELNASLIKEQPGGAWLVRADELPLVFSVMGTQALVRGACVRVRLGTIDPIALDVHGTITEVLAADSQDLADSADEDDDETGSSLTIAVDLDEEDPPADPSPASRS